MNKLLILLLLLPAIPSVYAIHSGTEFGHANLTESISISDNFDTVASFSIILNDIMGLVDSIANTLDVLIDPPVEPTSAPEPTPVKSSSGGSGRTNVSPQDIAKKSNTSFSKVSDWVSSDKYFKIGIRDLISRDYIGSVTNIPTTAPDWFYGVGQEWNDGNISNEEYFNAVKYLIDHKILK